MKVRALLDEKGHDVISITPDATVYDALKLMSEKEIGALVVLEGETLVGIISERDYARKVILKGRASKETPVQDIMTSKVIHTNPGMKLKKCLSVMTKNKFRHMPVVENDRVVGVISVEDLRRKL